MAIDTPTTDAISDNIVAQLETSLNQTIPLLPRSFIRVLSKALAGVFVLLYKYAGWIHLQMFVRTASWDPTTINGVTVRPLVEWGVLVGVGEPEAAVRAELLVDLTVRQQGGTLPAGRSLLNSATGVTYVTIGETALDAATVQTTVRAVSDEQGGGGRGVIGNMSAGETLSFASPQADVEREATVDSQEVTGADAEDETAYRRRVIQRFRQRPQGGAYADYQEWATEPTGIIAAYPYTGSPGTVDIYVEATEDSSGSPDGIPTASQLSTVEGSINYDPDTGIPTRRPVNAKLDVQAITRTAFDVEIDGLDVDDVAATEQLIEDAAEEYLRSLEPYIMGLSVLPRRDVISDPQLSGIIYDVVTAQGGTIDGLTISESGSPVTRRALGDGEKAKLGSISFINTVT